MARQAGNPFPASNRKAEDSGSRQRRNDPGLLVTGRGRFGAFGTRSGELNGGTTNRWSPDASDHEVAKKMTEYVEALSESDRAEVAQQTLKRCGMASSKGRA